MERCECYDKADGHPLPLQPPCMNQAGELSRCIRVEEKLTTLYRVDMDDETGTKFCTECGVDAMESGLFADEETLLDEDDDSEEVNS